MIIIDEETAPQGGEAWKEIRRGVISASEAKCIMTPTGKAAKTDYMYRLLSERFTNDESTFGGTEATERGKELEPEALEDFVAGLRMFGHDVDCMPVSFVFGDESRLFGCSPDQFLRIDGKAYGYEGKAPMASKVLMYADQDGIPKDYILQVMFSLWCCNYESTEVEGWYFHAYHPQVAPHTVLVKYDDEFKAWTANFEPIFHAFLQRFKDKIKTEQEMAA